MEFTSATERQRRSTSKPRVAQRTLGSRHQSKTKPQRGFTTGAAITNDELCNAFGVTAMG
jgi:hypothetical protein